MYTCVHFSAERSRVHLLHPWRVTLVFISVVGRDVPPVPSDSLTFLRARQQTRQTGVELIWVSRYRSTNRCALMLRVADWAILRTIAQLIRAILCGKSRTFTVDVFAHRKCSRLSSRLSETKSSSCNRTINVFLSNHLWRDGKVVCCQLRNPDVAC